MKKINNILLRQKISNEQKDENNQSTRKMEKIIKVQIKWMNVFVSDDCVCLSMYTTQHNWEYFKIKKK